MIFLVDYNLTGYVVLFQGTLAAEGWLELLSIRFVTLSEVGLAADTNDRLIWRFAQSNQMLLLTANRNAKGEDSLEQTIREEGTLTTLPVITISSLDRLIEREYREQCSARIVEIVLDIENYLGVSRLFIP
ncbi:MAG: ACP S-malonyltransferase [Nostoc sp. TH1S01]|uniref:ACP S-malonyltransferase n=1 Tax=unclassified Nostoc TaxID=2593658 RepID=UPI00168977E5|nr:MULTISPECIES: ACP S-malonyltransferase [unclassified Nostoc]MBD2302025.1 ACP S-malonyltransferase [Nostoc sp. FACHB-190]MBD2497461.1 ACP S-malonyltransferase [Nostoc sp. FACHB-280]MBU7586902.1 ACP S-malonyltransferase [Nostoc sp. TH1S01]